MHHSDRWVTRGSTTSVLKKIVHNVSKVYAKKLLRLLIKCNVVKVRKLYSANKPSCWVSLAQTEQFTTSSTSSTTQCAQSALILPSKNIFLKKANHCVQNRGKIFISYRSSPISGRKYKVRRFFSRGKKTPIKLFALNVFRKSISPIVFCFFFLKTTGTCFVRERCLANFT